MKVNGPYVHTTGRLAGRRYVNIVYNDGTKTSKLYSRFLMELHLGRELSYDETVDHIDEDFTNDALENLAILTRADNVAKNAAARRPVDWFTFICPVCKSPAKQQARHVRHNRKQGKAGPFCGKVCARKYQLGNKGI